RDMSTHPATQSEPGPLWLAAEAVTAEPEPSTYVTFELAGQVFAVDVAHVREVLDMQPIARLPNAAGDVLGMIDVRGESIAVIDLPSRLGIMRSEAEADARIVVLEMQTAR
ncbi:MAG: chemotaxis protein CheW, partial [Rubrimonas sp.]